MSALVASAMAGSLLPALVAANRAVARRATLPVLGGIHVASDDAALRLTGTDLEVRITTHAPAKVLTDGVIVIPAIAFLAFVKRTPRDARIDITAGDIGARDGWQSVTLSSVVGSVTLQGWTDSEYPTAVPDPKKPVAVLSLSAGDLSRALRSVLFSAGGDNTRPILTGVYLASGGSTLLLASCDNYRISEYVVPTLFGGTGDVIAVIPATSLDTWLRIWPLPGDDPTTITILSATLARIEYSGDAYRTTLTTRIIDGSFPNYRTVVPLTFAGTALVDRDTLAAAAKSMKTKVARLAIEPDVLTLTGRDWDGGEYRSVIPAIYDGPSVVIGIDPTLLAGIANAPGTEIAIKPNAVENGALSPITFTCPTAPSWTHVLMPTRLPE